jgi:hypothetical protein
MRPVFWFAFGVGGWIIRCLVNGEVHSDGNAWELEKLVNAAQNPR